MGEFFGSIVATRRTIAGRMVAMPTESELLSIIRRQLPQNDALAHYSYEPIPGGWRINNSLKCDTRRLDGRRFADFKILCRETTNKRYKLLISSTDANVRRLLHDMFDNILNRLNQED
jgi:hypothetical protein